MVTVATEMSTIGGTDCFYSTDLLSVDHLVDLFAHYFLRSISFCFSYSYVRQTKLVSSLNFWVHNKIVIV